MKYTILGFSQSKLIDYKLSIIDVHILRWFVDFYQTGKMYKITDDETGYIFSWVKYDAVLADLPLLGITNVRVIARRFDTMCECGLMLKIVKKTARGTYSCFALDPEKYNALLSDVPQTAQETNGNTPTVLKSTVGSEKEDLQRASALKSTVALSAHENESPTVLKSTVGSENQAENEATVLDSTVATVLKSTVLLKNSSPNLNPLTKIPASAASVRTTLFELDHTLVLDAEFYAAAADFLEFHNLGEEYLRWFYQNLKASKRITNLPGYFFKVFFKTVYVERYKAFCEVRKPTQERIIPKDYICPVCGTEQQITSDSRVCECCESPVNPSDKDIARYKVFYRMDEEKKTQYISARSKIFFSGGNVSQKLVELDEHFGIVS